LEIEHGVTMNANIWLHYMDALYEGEMVQSGWEGVFWRR